MGRRGVNRVYPQAFKIAAVEQMEAAANITAVSRALGVQRELLYLWRGKYRAEGPAGLRDRGRPRPPTPAAEAPAAPRGDDPARRIAALERTVGQQALELDFFRAALKHFGPRRTEDEASETGSTP